MTAALLARAAYGGPKDRPSVIATIGPVHAIAAQLLRDIATPHLLVEANASPHTYALKPSDARRLAEAEFVVLASPRLETFLERALQRLSRSARVVILEQAPGLQLLPLRDGQGFAAHSHEGHNHSAKHTHHPGQMDVHFWLDPDNGKAAARHLAHQLAAGLPAHRPIIERNLMTLISEVDAAQAQMRAELDDLRGKPFFVFHDAYQYFERRFGLEASGAIVTGNDLQPGAKRLLRIRDTIKKGRALCVFSEPQFDPKLARMLVEGTEARIGSLDPEGVNRSTGQVSSYPELLRSLARDFAVCMR
jgi:zinc transport system substrate-binding protein